MPGFGASIPCMHSTKVMSNGYSRRGDKAASKTDNTPVPMEFTFYVGRGTSSGKCIALHTLTSVAREDEMKCQAGMQGWGKA